MVKRFKGESVHKVDSKGRVSIPALFRRVLELGDPEHVHGANPNLVLVYGRKGRNCIEGYSIKSMDEIDDMIADLPPYSPQREVLERMINTQSIYAQVDENGRIVLPAKLREMFDIQSEAQFCGMGDKFQIWNPTEYEEDKKRLDSWLEEQGTENDPFALLDRRRRRED